MPVGVFLHVVAQSTWRVVWNIIIFYRSHVAPPRFEVLSALRQENYYARAATKKYPCHPQNLLKVEQIKIHRVAMCEFRLKKTTTKFDMKIV